LPNRAHGAEKRLTDRSYTFGYFGDCITSHNKPVVSQNQDVGFWRQPLGNRAGKGKTWLPVRHEYAVDVRNQPQPLERGFLSIAPNSQSDRVHAVDMHDNGRWNHGVHARFDGRTQAERIVGRINEIDSAVGARITHGDRLTQGFDQDGRHYVVTRCVGEPFSGRFDPHDSIAFDGCVAASRLRAKRIGAKRSR
jgi:hypothetical protein